MTANTSRNEIVTFEQVNRVYSACAAWAKSTGYPIAAWYKGACEFVTGMPEFSRPDVSDAPASSAFGFGSAGHIPAAIVAVARGACDVSNEEIWAA